MLLLLFHIFSLCKEMKIYWMNFSLTLNINTDATICKNIYVSGVTCKKVKFVDDLIYGSRKRNLSALSWSIEREVYHRNCIDHHSFSHVCNFFWRKKKKTFFSSWRRVVCLSPSMRKRTRNHLFVYSLYIPINEIQMTWKCQWRR